MTNKEKPITYKKDGYYQLSVTMQKKTFTFLSRGYKVRSWIDFEDSLGLKCDIVEITQEQYENLHWMNSELTTEKATDKAAAKPTEKAPKQKKVKPKGVALENFFE
jgi:hypothetical protein